MRRFSATPSPSHPHRLCDLPPEAWDGVGTLGPVSAATPGRQVSIPGVPSPPGCGSSWVLPAPRGERAWEAAPARTCAPPKWVSVFPVPPNPERTHSACCRDFRK